MSEKDKAQASLESILARLGRDPKNAAGGWRSRDPYVVALMYAASGYPVFPCSKTKCPLTKHGFYDASIDLQTLARWGRYKHAYGWCVRTGRYEGDGGPLGLWIFDIDDELGYARLAELESELGPLPKTWTNMSGRMGGGEHRLFAPASYGPDMKTVGKALIHGKRGKIDQKGRGGYAVTAASYHVSGNSYYWATGCAPDETPLASLPPQWVEAMDKADSPAPQNAAHRLRSGSSTQRRPYDPTSLLIGDGPGYGNFQNPIYKNAIKYFFMAGVEAPAEIAIKALREMIMDAPKDHGRDVSRYLSGSDLPRIVERARAFVIKVKGNEGDYEDDSFSI